MELKQVAKRILRAVNIPLNAIGIEITKRGANPTYHARLQLMKKLGFNPRVLYDCGAYVGQWTVDVSAIFPGAQVVLFEPNPTLQSRIQANIAAIKPQPILVQAAVGDSIGTGSLNVWNNEHTSDQGSSLLSHVQSDAKTKVATPIVTLDSVAAERNLRPDLIKLDLQGFEGQALRGATELLRNTEVVLVEFTLAGAYVGNTTPRQFMEIMYDNDYVLYDIVDLLYRPYDNALSSGDFFFVKNNSPLQSYKGYT